MIPGKRELQALADAVLLDEPFALGRAIVFFLESSRGFWHNRARAMLARRFKHCEISLEDRVAIVSCICERLTIGDFTEQFRDQLRLARLLDRRTLEDAAIRALHSRKDYVRRYARWVLERAGRDRPISPGSEL